MQLKIGNIETAHGYFDRSMKKAKKVFDQKKASVKTKDPFEKSLKLERERLFAIREIVAKDMSAITTAFPSLDNISEFYKELIKTTMDFDKLRKELAGCNWVMKKTADLVRMFAKDYASSKDKPDLLIKKRSFMGRFSSLFKRIDFEYLEKARKIFKKFPSIKSGLFTVAIAGFPNVGKSTLLSKITPATPEINSYAFTTKGLNTGYMNYKYNKLQFIDTPGTLNRLEKMNAVEKQAYIAMKYASHLLVFVYDLTESSYPLELQHQLKRNIESYGKDIIVYLSKNDILEEEILNKFISDNPELEIYKDVDSLKKRIIKYFVKDYLM